MIMSIAWIEQQVSKALPNSVIEDVTCQQSNLSQHGEKTIGLLSTFQEATVITRSQDSVIETFHLLLKIPPPPGFHLDFLRASGIALRESQFYTQIVPGEFGNSK